RTSEKRSANSRSTCESGLSGTYTTWRQPAVCTPAHAPDAHNGGALETTDTICEFIRCARSLPRRAAHRRAPERLRAAEDPRDGRPARTGAPSTRGARPRAIDPDRDMAARSARGTR